MGGLAKEVVVLVSILMLAVGIILGITSSPMVVGLTVTIGFIFYILLWIFYPPFRYPFLFLMIGGDIAAIAFVLFHPLVLPFLIIESGNGHSSVIVDFVQIISVIELVYYLYNRRKR